MRRQMVTTMYNKNKIISQKKPFNCAALLVSSITHAAAVTYFFSCWNLISSLVENYLFQFGNKVKLVHST